MAEILKVIQAPDSHLNNSGVLGRGFFCQGHVDLFQVPLTWAPLFFFIDFHNLLFELITVIFNTAAFDLASADLY